MNGSGHELSSKLRRGKEKVVIWRLMGKEDEDFLLLESLSECVVNVGGGDNGSKAQLRFYLEGKMIDGDGESEVDENFFASLGLYANQHFNEGRGIHQYEIKVDPVDDELNTIHLHNADVDLKSFVTTVEAVKESKTVRQLKLKEEFLMLGMNDGDIDAPDISGWTVADFPTVADVMLKISVTPMYFDAEVENQSGAGTDSLKEETSLCQALKAMFAKDETYSDLKLETKDNMTLCAHKFIFAARSPVLRARIEREMKENDFNGTIKLGEVNAEPMKVVLHWIYTAELHESAENCLEEVVDAAIKFELTDLIKILDKKVISVCNKENMFQLYRTAEKNGMMTAVADVSKFIKENI